MEIVFDNIEVIKLRVPDSGDEWLDKMITQSLRDEIATKAIQELLCKNRIAWPFDLRDKSMAEAAYKVADVVLKERGAQPTEGGEQ